LMAYLHQIFMEQTSEKQQKKSAVWG
jgi:hypothetical protein